MPGTVRRRTQRASLRGVVVGRPPRGNTAGRVDGPPRVPPGAGVWARRAVLAVVLVGAVVIPSRAVSQQALHCEGPSCRAHGSILWTASLTGSWLAEAGVTGTVPSLDAAYAASGGGLAVLGEGLEVTGFRLRTGTRMWQTALTGLPVGSAIIGVRAFAGVVAVGVQPPAGAAPARDEVMLSAATGHQIRTYPAAAYGGAIAADASSTVVVGPTAVTAYANATGRVLWSRATGPAGQTWRVSGQYVYVAESGSPSGVLLVRRINLSSGAVQVLRPSAHAVYPGTLSAVVDGVMLFSESGGEYAYSDQTGGQLWQRDSSVLELADVSSGTVYLASGNALSGIDVRTGTVVSRATLSVAGSLYWVARGVALGLDQDALGDAWGYDLVTRRVLWTSAALPWPHFFIDLSGLGGSASPAGDVILLASCARVGGAAGAATGSACARPELAAVLI
jgi:outer membrane protein assembly factor BamB